MKTCKTWDQAFRYSCGVVREQLEVQRGITGVSFVGRDQQLDAVGSGFMFGFGEPRRLVMVGVNDN